MDDEKRQRAERAIAEAARQRQSRAAGYREQALKLFPWVCGRCGRTFSRERLRELTVHHKDHNHDNNPADGSNWELLCLYCHDNEHARQLDAEAARHAVSQDGARAPDRATSQALAPLGELLAKNRGEGGH